MKTRFNSKLYRYIKDSRGTAYIEFAVIIPVLLYIVFLAFEYTRFLRYQQIVATVSYEFANAALRECAFIGPSRIFETTGETFFALGNELNTPSATTTKSYVTGQRLQWKIKDCMDNVFNSISARVGKVDNKDLSIDLLRLDPILTNTNRFEQGASNNLYFVTYRNGAGPDLAKMKSNTEPSNLEANTGIQNINTAVGANTSPFVGGTCTIQGESVNPKYLEIPVDGYFRYANATDVNPTNSVPWNAPMYVFLSTVGIPYRSVCPFANTFLPEQVIFKTAIIY